MSALRYTHRVYSEGNAGRWQGSRGFLVRGSSVYCESLDVADRIARNMAGVDVVTVPVDGDGGTYYYATQDEADADLDGSAAAAVVYEVTAEEREALAAQEAWS